MLRSSCVLGGTQSSHRCVSGFSVRKREVGEDAHLGARVTLLSRRASRRWLLDGLGGERLRRGSNLPIPMSYDVK